MAIAAGSASSGIEFPAIFDYRSNLLHLRPNEMFDEPFREMSKSRRLGAG
jgi:hypothetical protein|tara:strand:+ start:4380 stop:4529 length:150 start_codon:yes stop_codon:yes gene_type:complete